MTEQELKDTMLLLKKVKEEVSPKDAYICRKMIRAAACLSNLDGLRGYSWFLEQLKSWLEYKPTSIDDFFYIGIRAKNNDTFYRIKARTVLYGNNGDFEQELHKVWEEARKASKYDRDFPF